MIKARGILTQYGIAIVLVVMCLVIGFLNPVFLSAANLINILVQASIIAIIAVGMTYVIITEGIDLSVGSLVALSGVVLGILLDSQIPLPFSILGCLAVGSLCGLVNGLVVTVGNVNPFVATLGMMSIARGLALLLTKGRSVSGFDESFLFFADGHLLGLPIPVVIMFSVVIIAALILRFTYWGQYIYAIGGNERAAWLSGISVKKYTTAVYVLSGLLSAVACIILTARLNSAQPVAGNMYELDAIAAAVIGGASLSGGRGTIVGAIVGALILAVLKNGLSILNISSYVQQIAIGAVIVVAVLVDNLNKRS